MVKQESEWHWRVWNETRQEWHSGRGDKYVFRSKRGAEQSKKQAQRDYFGRNCEFVVVRVLVKACPEIED